MTKPTRRQIFQLAGGAALKAVGSSRTLLLRSGWDVVNIGDIGHTPGALRILERGLPDGNVIVWMPRVNQRIEAMIRRRFPNVDIVQGRVRSDSGPDQSALRSAFERSDLVMQNSGMMTDTGWMTWSNRMGKTWGLYGQSYFPDFASRPEIVALLNAARFIYCRDSVTLTTLKKAGVKVPTLEFCPDSCFAVDVRDEDRGLAFMRKHGLRERQFLTIMLRTNTPKHPDVITDKPLDANGLTGAPTMEQRLEDERRAAVYREVIAAWIRKTGQKILIAPEVEKEIEHNKHLLYDPLSDDLKSYVVNRETFWNVDEAASIFARARIVLCHEPHSCIIAMGMGTPIVHTYSQEHGWPKAQMFADLGSPEWLMDFDRTPAAGMTETLLAIHNRYGEALLKVRKAMNLVEARWADTMEIVRKALQG